MRWSLYAGVSVTLAAGVVVKAMHQRANFYAASVYLAKSTANLMILANALLLVAGLFMLGLQRIFYGPLRPLEVEQLYEKSWIAITETCFAMTIFRGELGGWFLIMFLGLLASRIWSWIGEGRVEILEQQPPANPRLFHTRFAASLILSALFNSSMLKFCVKTVLRQAKPDMMVMFGFEFAVLTTQSLSTIARYAISLVEIWVIRKQKQERLVERRAEIIAGREQTAMQEGESDQFAHQGTIPTEVEVDEAELEVPGWDEKGKWILYLELLTDFVKLSTYIAFFWILLMFYGLPIHIFRDVYITFRSFVKRIIDFRKYRKATRDMQARYPDATSEEISREDVCIICREEMRPIARPNAGPHGDQSRNRRPLGTSLQERMRPKKLPCGHILHFSCLRSWLERQQICPTCRRPVVTPTDDNNDHVNRNPGDVGRVHEAAPGHDALQRGGNGQNQARVFRLGPLRIAFGPGQGNFDGDLANQIQQGNGAQQQPDLPNAGGTQRIGFGFRTGPQPAQNLPQTASRSTPSNIQLQLRQIENQINQEINGLRAATDQLSLVRALQLELERLRMPQNSRPINSSEPMPQLPRPQSQVLFLSGQQNVIHAGDNRLPQGLTLPDGWSMMPLQRAEQRLPGPLPVPHNPVVPNLRSPGTASTASTFNGGVTNIVPSSTTQPTSQVGQTTTRLQQAASDVVSSALNNNPLQSMTTSTMTPSRSTSEPPPEQLRLADTVPSASAEQSTETGRTVGVVSSTNTEPALDSTSLPSWGSSTMPITHDVGRRATISDSETSSSSVPDRSGSAGDVGKDKGTPSPRPEKEESRALAGSVEDCIEDVD